MHDEDDDLIDEDPPMTVPDCSISEQLDSTIKHALARLDVVLGRCYLQTDEATCLGALATNLLAARRDAT